MHRVLFICSRNRLRSPSAERLFANWPGVETDSAGLAADAETPQEQEQLEWATLVVVMERRHRRALLRRHAAAMKGKRLVCLDIPDDYAYMQAGIAASAGAQGGAFPSAGLSGADRERKKKPDEVRPEEGGPGVSPVRQGVRSAWAPARGCRTSGCGRCG